MTYNELDSLFANRVCKWTFIESGWIGEDGDFKWINAKPPAFSRSLDTVWPWLVKTCKTFEITRDKSKYMISLPGLQTKSDDELPRLIAIVLLEASGVFMSINDLKMSDFTHDK